MSSARLTSGLKRRLVDGTDDGDLGRGGDVLEEGHHHRGARRVHTGGRLVEEEHTRLLRHGQRDREPPLQPAAQPAHELVASLRVLHVAQPDLCDELVDCSLALARGEIGLIAFEGDGQVLAHRDRRPQRVLLRHVRAVLVVPPQRQVVAVKANEALRLATKLLQREHVEECGLARARRAKNREHVAWLHVA